MRTERKRPYPPTQRYEWCVLENPDFTPPLKITWGEPLTDRNDTSKMVISFGHIEGPLRWRYDVLSGYVKNILGIGTYVGSVAYIGCTMVGKTRAATGLVYALGGSIYERINKDGRTVEETDLIFGAYTNSKGLMQLYALKLNTNAGHSFELSKDQWERYLDINQKVRSSFPYVASIVVVKATEDLEKQIDEVIMPLMKSWGIQEIAQSQSGPKYHVSLMFTHEGPGIWRDVPKSLESLVSSVHYVDNSNPFPRLSEVPNGTIMSLVDAVRSNINAPDFKLIYFAGKNKEIPLRFTNYVIHLRDTPFRLRESIENDLDLKKGAEMDINPTDCVANFLHW